MPPHTHDENSTKDELLENLLRPQLSQALLDRERDFKRNYSSTFEGCREQTARSHAFRNRFKLRHHLDISQKVLYENHRQDLSKCQKLQQRRLDPFTVTKRVTSTTYQIQDDKDPSVIKTVHPNHLVEYYPKEESLLAMIEEYVSHDQRHDDFYERFVEQRIGNLNSFTEPPAEDTIPFPIRPLPTAPGVALHKRDSITSSDWELARLMFFRQPYLLLLNNYHNIHRRRRLNSRQRRLQLDHLLRFNNFCGTVASPKRENENISDLSHRIPILNRFYVPSLARAKNSDKQQFVVAQYSLTFSLFRNSLPIFLYTSNKMPKCHKFYPDCQWTVIHCWPYLTLDKVLLTNVYWSYSTHIVRVCFTPLLKLTLDWYLKRKRNVQLTFNSPAMESFHELLCYHSLEDFDPILDEFLTFTQFTQSSLYSSSAISTVLPEATDCLFNDF